MQTHVHACMTPCVVLQDNGELNASLRQLLTRIPHADRMSIDLGSGGIGREDSKGLGRGVSVRSSNLSPSQVLPSRVLHTGVHEQGCMWACKGAIMNL